MGSEKHFRLFSNCVPVKGAMRSVICDLQRNQFDFIPNDLFNIISLVKVKSFDEIKKSFSVEDVETIIEYFDFLVSKEYGFWCTHEEVEMFPEIDFGFESPSIITNAIIDVDHQSSHDFSSLYVQLEDLGCQYLQIRCFSSLTYSQILGLIHPLIDNRIRSIQLVVQSTAELSEEKLKSLCRKNLKITSIIVAGHEENKSLLAGVDRYTQLHFTTDYIKDCGSCGNVHPNYFAINIPAFSESLQFNSCLNRKISVASDGEIKNCPSLKKSFGNASNTQLKNALMHPDFKNLWGINKDQIIECMDCEFRHICTDCRAYLKDPNSLYSKPAKCNYNPYIAEWGNDPSIE